MTGHAADVLRDTLFQDATGWLRWLEKNVPRDGDQNAPARWKRARQSFADYAEGKHAIPVRTDAYATSSGWQHQRDAVLLAMMLKHLNALAQRWGTAANLSQLREVLGTDPAPFRRGLAPEGKESDDPPREDAKGFLPDGLTTLLAELRIAAPQRWNPCDPDLLSAWARVWTLAAVTVLIDWIIAKGGRTIAISARWLWTGNLPTLRGKGGITPALPTGDKKLRVRLVGSPLVCAVVNDTPGKSGLAPSEGDPALAETTIVMRDLNHFEEGDKTYYAGRKVLHLYMAAWIERVAQFLNAQEGEPTMDKPPSNPSSDSGSPADVAPGQAPTVGFLQSWFAGTGSSAGGWLARPGSAAGNDLAQFRDYPDVYKFVPRVVAAMADACDATLGTLNIQWSLLQETGGTEWLDVEVIVRQHGQWRRLPLDMDEVDDGSFEQGGAAAIQGGDATAEGVALRLSLDAERSTDSFGIAVLRAGLAQAKWVYRQAGLGIFIAGAIDLDSGDAAA